MKAFFNGLLPKIIIAIILGTLLGYIVPEFFVRLFATFNSMFSNFLGFCIPLIIMGLIISGIADLGKSAGKLLLLTVAFAYCSTLFSGIFTFFISKAVFPLIISSGHSALLESTETATVSLQPFFVIEMPALFDVMSALIIAFVLGIGISRISGDTMKNFFSEFKGIIEKVIKSVIIPLLPIFIFGIFLNMSYSGEVFQLMSEFGKVIAFIIALSFVLLAFQFTLAGIIVKRNPIILFRNMLPAYMTALGTASSAATIPVTLAQVKSSGVNSGIADFCVPLCATIHLSGSAMKVVGMSIAIIYMQGLPIDFLTYLGFIFMLGITMVAAPGVPGGAIMAAVAILQSILGFNEQAIAVMIAVYVAIDSFGTACNVTGDGAISLIINKLSGFKLKES